MEKRKFYSYDPWRLKKLVHEFIGKRPVYIFSITYTDEKQSDGKTRYYCELFYCPIREAHAS